MPRLLAELVRRSPWGWRAASVTSVSPDGWLLLACRDGHVSSPVHAWHHDDLVGALPVGTPVRLHQRMAAGGGQGTGPVGLGPAALSCPVGLVSLHVEQGPPAVPDLVDLDTWADDDGAVVIDLRTRALLTR